MAIFQCALIYSTFVYFLQFLQSFQVALIFFKFVSIVNSLQYFAILNQFFQFVPYNLISNFCNFFENVSKLLHFFAISIIFCNYEQLLYGVSFLLILFQ
jgi:hypothetical protein